MSTLDQILQRSATNAIKGICEDMELLHTTGHTSNPWENCPLCTFKAMDGQIPQGIQFKPLRLLRYCRWQGCQQHLYFLHVSRCHKAESIPPDSWLGTESTWNGKDNMSCHVNCMWILADETRRLLARRVVYVLRGVNHWLNPRNAHSEAASPLHALS